MDNSRLTTPYLSGTQDVSRLSLLHPWKVAAILMVQNREPTIIPFPKKYYRRKTLEGTSDCYLISSLLFQRNGSHKAAWNEIPFPVSIAAELLANA